MSLLSKAFEIGFKAAGYDKKALEDPTVKQHLKKIKDHQQNLNQTYNRLEELTGLDLSDQRIHMGYSDSPKTNLKIPFWMGFLMLLAAVPVGLVLVLILLKLFLSLPGP